MYDLFLEDEYAHGFDHGVNVRMEVREGFGKHQLAILDYPVPASNYVNLAPDGTPLTLTWGTSPVDKRVLNGYVNHHEYWWDTHNTGARYLRFFCTGTSRPLNEPNTGSWKGVSASYIAREIAERHGLRIIAHQSPSTLPYWSQGQDSDFVMLNRLAKEVGYRFWVDGSTLYFVDPSIALTYLQRDVPEYALDQSTDDTLIRVQSIYGPDAPVAGSSVTQKIFGIDSSTNRFFQATSSRPTNDLGLTTPSSSKVLAKDVSSLAEADRLNEAAAVEGVWARIQATTVGFANTRVGTQVSLVGDALNQIYQGEWTASDIIHVISTQRGITNYRTQIDLIRNQKDGNFFKGSGLVKSAIREIPAVLRGGSTWESEILETVYV